jgi:hypothetical protein
VGLVGFLEVLELSSLSLFPFPSNLVWVMDTLSGHIHICLHMVSVM